MKKRILSVVVLLAGLMAVTGCGAKMNAQTNEVSKDIADTLVAAESIKAESIKSEPIKAESVKHAKPVKIDVPAPEPEEKLSGQVVWPIPEEPLLETDTVQADETASEVVTESLSDEVYELEYADMSPEELQAVLDDFYATEEEIPPMKYVKDDGDEAIIIENFMAPGTKATLVDADGNTYEYFLNPVADSYYYALNGGKDIMHLDIYDLQITVDAVIDRYADFFGHYTFEE